MAQPPPLLALEVRKSSLPADEYNAAFSGLSSPALSAWLISLQMHYRGQPAPMGLVVQEAGVCLTHPDGASSLQQSTRKRGGYSFVGVVKSIDTSTLELTCPLKECCDVKLSDPQRQALGLGSGSIAFDDFTPKLVDFYSRPARFQGGADVFERLLLEPKKALKFKLDESAAELLETGDFSWTFELPLSLFNKQLLELAVST